MSQNPFSPNYKSDYTPAKTSRGFVKKGEKLNQPPINSQAVLQADPPMKSAKLSRGKAI